MKNCLNFLRSISLLLFLIVITGCNRSSDEQVAQKDVLKASKDDGVTYIVLLVDTDNIVKGSEMDFCIFANQPTNTTDDNFTTDLFIDDEVEWIGFSYSNPKDQVNIKKVKGPKLNQVLTQGDINGVNGKAKGRVKNDPVKKEKKKYTLHFEVIRENDTIEGLKIDPKIRVMDNSDTEE